MKAQLAQLDEIKRDREVLEGEIKAVTFDMTTKFLTALAQDGAINEEALSAAELDTRYSAYTQRVQQNLRSQEEILAHVQVCTLAGIWVKLVSLYTCGIHGWATEHFLANCRLLVCSFLLVYLRHLTRSLQLSNSLMPRLITEKRC